MCWMKGNFVRIWCVDFDLFDVSRLIMVLYVVRCWKCLKIDTFDFFSFCQ